MNIRALLLLLVIATTLPACKKNDDDASVVPAYYLRATINGQAWKADASLFADKAIVMTISGLSQQGSSLTLELDDFTPGTYSIKQSRNHVLYTSQLADAFESTDGNPGTLVILSNDASQNIIKGTFNLTAQSPITGNITISNGEFELYYTE